MDSKKVFQAVLRGSLHFYLIFMVHAGHGVFYVIKNIEPVLSAFPRRKRKKPFALFYYYLQHISSSLAYFQEIYSIAHKYLTFTPLQSIARGESWPGFIDLLFNTWP